MLFNEYFGCRNMLLEQLSELPHAPSVPFQMTPSTTEVPEEVCSWIELFFLHVYLRVSNMILLKKDFFVQREEDMDQRPNPRIWNGDEYFSEGEEDEKPRLRRSSDANMTPRKNSNIRWGLEFENAIGILCGIEKSFCHLLYLSTSVEAENCFFIWKTENGKQKTFMSLMQTILL